MNLKIKIANRMDRLQEMMETNLHLTCPDDVEMHIESISKFWSTLSEEDKEYIECARYALEGKKEWNL
jgi:hypothetical protein